MKRAALILFGLSLIALIVLTGCRWGFPPMPVRGPEGGLIVAALAHAVGLFTSLLAALFASVAMRRNEGDQGSRVLMGGSGLLLLSFVAILLA